MTRRLSFGLALALAALSPSLARAAGEELKVGSKRFTESYLLAEIAAGTARRAGATVTHQQGIGGTALAFRALEEGSIDLYPEYTGTIVEAILQGQSKAADVPSLRRALAPRGIGVSDPLGFDDGYALALPEKLAAEKSLRSISDLARAPDLKFGLSPEFLGRSDGWPGLSKAYGLAPAAVQTLDHGLAYEAIARAAIDVTDAYSTDAKLGRFHLTVLRDDKRFFPSYQAVYLYREDAARRAPESFRALATLAGSIDEKTMIDLNARAEIDQEEFRSVADSFLARRSNEAPTAVKKRGSLARGLVEVVRSEGPRHLGLVAAAVLLSTLVGLPLGVVAARSPRLGALLVAATGLVQTIPSLALLCFFIPLFGTGALPALAALFLYGLLPIARNTVAGLAQIPGSLVEAAEAIGLSPRARLLRVLLPMASPTILAGIKTSAVVSVGTATLAAFIGAGGFGAPISTGLNLNDDRLILEGAIPAAGLALLVEGAFSLLERWVVPRGLRLPRSG